jgi:hypothetical protein
VTEYITYVSHGKRDLSFLTKYGITHEEAEAILYQARREADYQGVKSAVKRARDLAWEKKPMLEKLMSNWDRKVKNYHWLKKCEAEDAKRPLWQRVIGWNRTC